MGVGVARVEPRCALVVLGGSVQLALLMKRQRQVVVRVGESRFGFYRAQVIFLGLRLALLANQTIPQAVEGGRVARFAFECTAKVLFGQGELTLLHEQIPQVVAGVGVVRLDFDGAAEVTERPAGLPLFGKNAAAIVMSHNRQRTNGQSVRPQRLRVSPDVDLRNGSLAKKQRHDSSTARHDGSPVQREEFQKQPRRQHG